MRALVAGLAFGLLVAGSASAQYVISAHSGVIQYVEGTAYLNDKPVQPKAGEFPNIKENEIFRTEQGMAEVLLTPGVFLRLGENSSIKMVSAKLSDTRVEALTGSAMVECDDLEKDNAIMLLYKGNSMYLTKHGLYRVDADQGLFKVYDGEAIVKAESGQLTLHKGKETSLNGVLMAENFDVKDEDALYRWSDRRSGYLAKANVSSANSMASSGGGYGYYPGYGYPGYGFGGWNGWMFNPLFGMYTFVPYDGMFLSPFGYGFWSPYTVWQSPYFYGGGGGGVSPGVSRNPTSGGKHAPYTPVRSSAVARAAAGGGHAGSGGGFARGGGGGAVSTGSAASAGGHSGGGGGGHR